MYPSLDQHALAVRDRQRALRADAHAHRLVTRTRTPLAERLRCLGARIRVPAVPRGGCGRASAASR